VPHASFKYSNKPGDSAYPISEGIVFRSLQPIERFNPKLDGQAKHTHYIWVLKVYRLRKGCPPKRRDLGIVQVFVPKVKNGEASYLMKKSRVQMEYVRTLLRREFVTLATNCHFNYTDQSVKRFYKLINLL